MRRIVLDTNCLIQTISRRSPYYKAWSDFIEGRYILCVSTEILNEYEEILAQHISGEIASIVVESILRAPNVIRVDASYRFHLIEADPDDNKFVDCAIASNAEYIVSEDKHFDILKILPFPKIEVKSLIEFIADLKSEQ